MKRYVYYGVIATLVLFSILTARLASAQKSDATGSEVQRAPVYVTTCLSNHTATPISYNFEWWNGSHEYVTLQAGAVHLHQIPSQQMPNLNVYFVVFDATPFDSSNDKTRYAMNKNQTLNNYYNTGCESSYLHIFRFNANYPNVIELAPAYQ